MVGNSSAGKAATHAGKRAGKRFTTMVSSRARSALVIGHTIPESQRLVVTMAR